MRNQPFGGVPPPLTARPEGLLSLLGLQQRGQYPQHLQTDWLMSSVDLLEWYAEGKCELITNSVTVNAVGWAAGVAIPSGEYWYLRNVTFWRAGTVAGNEVYSIGVGTSSGLSYTLNQPYALTAGDYAGLTMDPQYAGTIVRPGQYIGAWCQRFSAATTLQITVKAIRLQI